MKSFLILLVLLLASYTSIGQQIGTPKNIIADTTVMFKVNGLCDLCKQRIEGALQLKGIDHAEWNVTTKMLTVSYDPSKINLRHMINKITEAGHDTYYKKASDVAYNALPGCCHYRDVKETSVANQPVSPSVDNISAAAQQNVKGIVLSEDKKGSFTPLASASVVWLDNNNGTATDSGGFFSLPFRSGQLVISYSGFKPDTITAIPNGQLRVILGSHNLLEEVKVTAARASTRVSSLDVYRTQNMSQSELFKAACCNLSESFETNPSVDVSYNDAVTGSKQIQLLGLAGVYTQLTIENLPGPRGLATALGLNYIPGTWIESIQLSKGTGSVANGYESIAGQINVELKKPATSEKLFANTYTDGTGKKEMNLNLTSRVGRKWATMLLLHDDFLLNKNLDFNHDGFRDLPTGNQVSSINRWSYDNGKGVMTQFGIKIFYDNKTGGQVGYNPESDKFTTNHYGIGIDTKRQEVFAKVGYVFPEKKYKSIGLQLSAFNHRQNSYFGFTTYDGHQQNFYSNLIYQSIINTTEHKFRAGFSFVYDNYNEYFNNNNFKRKEAVPGAFFEYTFSPSQKFDLVAGIREDQNSIYGWFITPRLNIRYQPFTNTTIRLSAGRGERTADIFAENNGVFASSRQLIIIPSNQHDPYGLQPEIAWDKGISIDQKFHLFHNPALFTVDFYRNDFVQQVVADVEDPRTISFYNLTGRSRSNSFQSEISFMPLSRLDMKFAYRLFDVKTTYGKAFLSKPLLSRDRGFASIDYSAGEWKFNYTTRYSGSKRLPFTQSNPPEYKQGNYSPGFVTMDAQVTYSFGKKNPLDIYIGAENITNYFQKDPIIAAAQPFSEYFDASMVWGPLTGRMFYCGVRYRIK